MDNNDSPNPRTSKSPTLVIDVETPTSYHTKIIEDSPHPYCALPDDFFSFALTRRARRNETTLLTIDRWDGREILSVIKRQ